MSGTLFPTIGPAEERRYIAAARARRAIRRTIQFFPKETPAVSPAGAIKTYQKLTTMQTETQTAPEVKPAITEADVVAGMLSLFAAAHKKNPGITTVGVSVIQYSHDTEPRVEWRGHGVNGACEISKPNASALVAGLIRQIGPKAASDLREKARRLLEEAEMIEKEAA